MKKLLALVLAMVMTLGLATVGASAATVKYADKNDIDYQEAADVLSTVGVFQGKGENFAPKDNLNRAEAAKLIAYLMLGTKTAEAIKGNGNRFSDVPADHWACGYIEYLATAGVVSGVGDNKFNPNGQVTAVQFAKMLNVALGYDAQVEGYVGESWNINIMKQANDDKIFDALEIGSNDVLTREQAAQMCLNALKADVVEYESKGDTLTINNSTVVLNAKKAKDKISNDSGKATKVKNDPVVGGYTLQLGEDRYNGDLEMVNTTDDFGRPASEWRYKTDKIGTYVKRGDIKQTYTDEVKRGPLYDMLGKAIYDDLVDNKALLYYFEDGVPFDGNSGLVNDLFGTKASNKTAIEKFVQKNGDQAICYGVGLNAANAGSTGNGTLTEVFVNDDHDEVTISVINTYAYKASSDYRASTEDIVIAPVETAKINLDSTRLTLEDFPEIKDLKKDDYILITAHQNTNSNNYEAKSAVKAELLTAKVDKYVYNDTVTLDGNVTKYSKKVAGDSKTTEYSIGQETTVVLDKYGYIIYVDEAVVSNNYVFISELYQGNGANTSKVKANAYFLDGTNSEITIKEISNLSSLSKSDMANVSGDLPNTIGVVENDRYVGWYTYNKNSSGEYTLNKAPSSRTVSGFRNTGVGDLTKSDAVMFLTNNTTVLAADSTNNVNGTFYQLDGSANTAIKANDKTVMVVTYAENNDVDIYTGVKNLPDITLGSGTTSKNAGEGTVFVVSDSTNHYAKYVFVSLQGDWSVYGTENESLLYIIKTDKKNVASSDTTYYTYKALDENAKEIKIEGDGSNVFGGADYTAFYKTSKNADGRYTRGSEVPNSQVGTLSKYINTSANTLSSVNAPITADNGALTIAGDSFTLDNNYKLVVVSKANALNKLKDTDYEASVVTADSLAAMVKGYDVEYYMQAKLKDNYTPNQGGKIIEAYVTITSAVVNANSSNGSTTGNSASGIVAVVLPELLRQGRDTWTGTSGTANTVVYVAGSVTPNSNAIQDALDDELALYGMTVKQKAVKNNMYEYSITSLMNENDTYPLIIVDPANLKTATAYDNSSYTLTSNVTGNLVVPEGKDVTVNGNINVSGDLIVAGTLTINSGKSLTMNGGNTTRYDVLRTGHIYVDGTFDATSTGASAAPFNKNVIDGHSIEVNSDAANINLGTVDVIGDLNIKKGTVAGTITVENGATMEVASTGNVTSAVTNNGTLTVGKNAGVSTAAGSSGTVKNESGTTVSASNGTYTQAKKTISVTPNNLTVDTDVTITATGASGSYTSYTVDADTVVFTIKNVSGSTLNLTASGLPTGSSALNGWTCTFSKAPSGNVIALTNNQVLTVTLKQSTSDVVSNLTVTLGKVVSQGTTQG